MRGLEVIGVCGYDLLVEESADPSNPKNSILLARNHPVVLIVGAAGFIGSHLVDKFLSLGVQVVGVDDLSLGRKENLSTAFKEKGFHFLHQSIEDDRVKAVLSEMPRLDYAVFLAETLTSSTLYKEGLTFFLESILRFKKSDGKGRSERPKIVLVSSIEIYDNEPSANLNFLKTAENLFAKYVKQTGLNGRVVRLAAVYGPRMHFREDEAFPRLIKATLEGRLGKEETALDFSTRGLFIDDAISLITKSVMSGSTNGKIYDGCLTRPIKVEELKRMLQEPVLMDLKEFSPSQLPAWSTPNLDRSQKELSWNPRSNIVKSLKETLGFFNDNQDARAFALEQKKQVEHEKKVKGWTFSSAEGDIPLAAKKSKGKGSLKNSFFGTFLLILILLGIFYPFLSFGIGAFTLNQSLWQTRQAMEQGDIAKAKQALEFAKISSHQMEIVGPVLNALRSINFLNQLSQNYSTLLMADKEGVEGIEQTLSAAEQAGKSYFVDSDTTFAGFNSAGQHLANNLAILADGNLNNLLIPNKSALLDRSVFQYFYNLVQKGSQAEQIIPQLLKPKQKYLFLLTDSSILRPNGGKIILLGELEFKNNQPVLGNVKNVGELDQLLSQKTVLLSKNNINTQASFAGLDSADFPGFAAEAKFLYQSLTGQTLGGVVMVDKNLAEKIRTKTGSNEEIDANFLPELLNRALFAGSIFKSAEILDSALSQKDLLVFSSENKLESLLTTQHWGDSVKAQDKAEGLADFLAVYESNHSNASNEKVTKRLALRTNFGLDGGVSHQLSVDYKNQNDTIYRSTVELILPLGTKLNSAKMGENNIVFSNSVDFGRAVYRLEIALNPADSQQLILAYSLPDKLAVGEPEAIYSLRVSKQPGSQGQPFDWQLNYPFSLDLVTQTEGVDTARRQLNLRRILDTDQRFELSFRNH